MTARRVTLPLIRPADAIDAAQSRALQLLALRCRPGDTDHRGLAHTIATLARHAVDCCLAPGTRAVHLDCIAEIQRWCSAPFALKSKALRSQLLEATSDSEAATAAAVTQMLTFSPGHEPTALRRHIERVIVRHARQASYYACSAVVLTLDVLDDPRRAIDAPQQVAGSLAHHAIWTRYAQDDELVAQSREHAELWAEHAATDHTAQELQLQLLHEFIGVTWKAQRDAQFGRLCGFLDWALAR